MYQAQWQIKYLENLLQKVLVEMQPWQLILPGHFLFSY